MARILIVGGGCRGRLLTRELSGAGHALRTSTREESRRGAIEAAGAECWIGSPARLGTLRAALEGVTVACWMLATAKGDPHELRALHTSRLEAFTRQLIDTTVRGFVYEAGDAAEAAGEGEAKLAGQAQLAAQGERTVRSMAAQSSIPLAVVHADPGDARRWVAQARAAIENLLARSG